MLPVLLGALAFAPPFWLLTPERLRRDVLALASLGGLAVVDVRLPIVLILFTALLLGAMRAIHADAGTRGRWIVGVGWLALLGLLLWNKLAAEVGGALWSQRGLVLLGVSYLVLKAAAALVESVRGRFRDVGFLDLLSWIVFLPIYPSGPIEELAHFRAQQPRLDRERVGRGLERILFGLLKALVLSHALDVWANPILGEPKAHAWGLVVLATYAFTLRFYLDFAGYSDIAIGLAAVFGYEIQENFDNPLIRRNLVQLWQHWHMTLTSWLRQYLFVPMSRAIMRWGGKRWDTVALVVAQLGTMTFCGVWHGAAWNFALWGLLQAVALVWVGIAARRLGRRLPRVWIRTWRSHPVAYGLSALLTFNTFSALNILVFADIGRALAIYQRLLGMG